MGSKEHKVTTRGDGGFERFSDQEPKKQIDEITTEHITVKAGKVELVLDGTVDGSLTIDGEPVPWGNISDIRLEAALGDVPKLFVTRVCTE